MKLTVHNPNNLPLIDYRQITELQGELKELSQDNYTRLVASLQENGFFIPFFVWQHDDTTYALDGHQRLRVLINEDAQPYELPYLVIEADTLAEAKKKLLVITSQYGTITAEGLKAFSLDLDESWIHNTTSFVNLFKPLNLNLKRDLLGGGAPPEEDEDDGGASGPRRKGNASHDDYSTLDFVMLHSNKTIVLEKLVNIKEEFGLPDQEAALMHLVENYRSPTG